METIGNIPVPEIAVGEDPFPLISDFPHEVIRRPQVVVHQFASGNAKIEQRFWLGNGARRYTVRKAHLNDLDRIALLEFWEDSYGSYGAFTYNAPSDDGLTTSEIVARFENQPLSIKHLTDMISSVGITLVEIPDPAAAPVYTWTATLTRFPDSALKAALLAQVQTIVPLIKIQPREPDYPAIYVSDRRCTVDYGGEVGEIVYLPRLVEWDGIGQSLDGASDDARFIFGNADRVMRNLANQTDLNRASIEFSLYHVGSGVKLDLWAGEIADFSIDAGPEFAVTASDGLYELGLPYPVRKVDRACWKCFNDGHGCPYDAEGSGGDPVFCDKGYTTPSGCKSHGMKLYFGGIIAEPQGASIKDNSTGTWGYGRQRITATSIVGDNVYGSGLREIYCDVDMPVPCDIAAGRDESDFYAALGIVGEGPLGAFGTGHKLDDQYHHGYPGALGLVTFVGTDPVTGGMYFGIDSNDVFAAGTPFIMLRRSDSKGLQLSKPGEHKLVAVISQGLSGFIWSGSPPSRSTGVLTNPVWIAVNALLRARGLRYAIATTQELYFDAAAAVAAAGICNDSVPKIVGEGNETQFRFRGIIQEEKPLRDWIEEILTNCLGYYTFAFGKLRIGIRNNSSTIEPFTVANILFNSLALRPLKPGFNHLTANFADAEFEFQNNSISLYDIAHAKQIGGAAAPVFLKSSMNLAGTASKSQAARIITTRLREELGGITLSEWKAARLLTFGTTVLALAVECGMVCSMTHPDMPGGGPGEFRVTRWRLNKDFSIAVEGRSTTASMYSLVSGPKPADVPASPVPVELGNDWAVPPAPVFGIFTQRDGNLILGPLGFGSTDNLHTLSAASFFIRYVDEIAGTHTTISEAIDGSTDPVTKIVASTAGIGDHEYAWHGAYDPAHAYVVYDSVSYLGDYYYCILGNTGHLPTETTYWLPLPRTDVAIDGEDLRVIGRDDGASTLTLARAQLESVMAAHNNGADVYLIDGRLEGFALTQRDLMANWQKTIAIPCVRITSVQALVTNYFGSGPVATNNYLIYQMEPDAPYGYRTDHADAPIVIGLPGAVSLGNPGVWGTFAHDRSIRDVYAWLPAGWAADDLTLNVLHKRWIGGTLTVIQSITLTVPHDAPVDAVSGASLLPGVAGDRIEYEVTGSVPAGCADLEVVIR